MVDRPQDSAADQSLGNLLRQLLPGRSDDEIAYFGLVYSGIRVGRDLRDCEVPLDSAGNPDLRLETYRPWLVDHLLQLDLEPLPEQLPLCVAALSMAPLDAAGYLAMNGSTYGWRANEVGGCVAEGKSFEECLVYLEELYDRPIDEDEAEAMRHLYDGMTEEIRTLRENCRRDFADDNELFDFLLWELPLDVGYRVPLAILMKRCEDDTQRLEVLRVYYLTFQEYNDK